MTKENFIRELRLRLSGLSEEIVEEHVAFYSEMIDDSIEDGNTEEEAVAAIGSVEDVAEQIIKEIPFLKLAKERIKPKRRLEAWEILLLALGSPIWISLIAAAFAVVVSLYAAIWSVAVSLWAVFISFAACVPACLLAGVIFAFSGNVPLGIWTAGCGIILSGIAIFLFFGCMAATRGIVLLTKKIALLIKKCFIRKGKSNE